MNIIVPTDFSECAYGAFRYALAWAQQADAQLHLFHAAALPQDWEDLPAVVRYRDEAHKAIALAVRDKLRRWQHEAQAAGLKCELHYHGGDLLEGLKALVDNLSADLVTMGSQGASGKHRWFMGSNAQKVVRELRIPVLVVKEAPDKLDLSQVGFVSGLFAEDQPAFRRFLVMLQAFTVEQVHVVTVKTEQLFGPPSSVILAALQDFVQLAEEAGYHCQTHYLSDLSVERGIRQFTETHQLGLLGISNHRRHPIKRFFQGSHVEMLVNQAGVPVLSVDYKD
ncbi:MAG: universal stress protein [Bacteroidetes bacterium]|nr:MAG: universal stress protein [Bacteroidota bacterium]